MGATRALRDLVRERWARRVERTLQVGIAAMLVWGLASVNVNVVVNATAALGVTLLPGVLERDPRVRLGAGLTALVALAAFLHVAGMFGLYEALFWWDHLTHTLSAVLVAATGYATVVALDEHSDVVSFPAEFTFVFVFLFTLALGVLWEVLEFAGREAAFVVGASPVLVQYGLEDTLLDLVFDAVGALLLSVFGAGELQGLVGTFVERFREPA